MNKVILIGRLGADPDIKYTVDGTMITSFRVATDENRKSKEGEKIQKTEWHRIITFKKLAEICSNFLTKGKLVCIEGKLQTRSWEDKEGIKRYTTEIIASTMQILDTKSQTKENDNINKSTNFFHNNTEEDIPF